MQTLSEAARSLGAGWPTVMLRVIVPNIAPAILNAALLSVALVLGEYTIAQLLNYKNLQVEHRPARSGQRGGLDRGRAGLAALRVRPAASSWRSSGEATQGRYHGLAAADVAEDEVTEAVDVETEPGQGVEVRLENLQRRYGAVDRAGRPRPDADPGELVALLGPSGCGKTTALRLVAGLEDADGGRVVVAGKDVTGLPANKRDMGMVFQAYSLFPHMTAGENVAFGLRMRGVAVEERKRRAGEMLELVGLSAQADRYAHQMSGGQQQRVALARALAIRPKVLLLDEPLSALDAKVRAQLRDEIRRVQLEVGITTLFVTHDQEEALAIADRVGVMRPGSSSSWTAGRRSTPGRRPPFVAEFVGLSNKLARAVARRAARCWGSGCRWSTRPRRTAPATAHRPARGRQPGRGRRWRLGRDPLVGTVIATAFLGAVSRVTVDLGTGSRCWRSCRPPRPPSTRPARGSGSTLRPDPVLVTAREASPGADLVTSPLASGTAG